MNITLEQAQKVVVAAIAKSVEMGVKMDIAVIDSGTNLTAFARISTPLFRASRASTLYLTCFDIF